MQTSCNSSKKELFNNMQGLGGHFQDIISLKQQPQTENRNTFQKKKKKKGGELLAKVFIIHQTN